MQRSLDWPGLFTTEARRHGGKPWGVSNSSISVPPRLRGERLWAIHAEAGLDLPQQSAQHVRQDAALAVVLDFHSAVDADERLKGELAAVLALDAHRRKGVRREVGGDAGDV